MSLNHLSRNAINQPMSPDKWPVMFKYLGDQGYRMTFWAQVDFPSVIPSYYAGVENGADFRMATKVQNVAHWMSVCVMTLYGEVLKYEQGKRLAEANAAKAKEAIDNGKANPSQPGELLTAPQGVLDGGGLAG